MNILYRRGAEIPVETLQWPIHSPTSYRTVGLHDGRTILIPEVDSLLPPWFGVKVKRTINAIISP